MCGICGFNFEDKGLAKRMCNSMRHRGPDDSGIYADSRVSLGHTRLSILDLSRKGRQPMSNEDGTVWITFNGEIYNYLEIRKGLKRHDFSSDTDTEVIIHGYEEYGLDILGKLRGMFAFCIYDTSRSILILARDNVGKKPLYYHFDGNALIFASEIKAMLESGIDKAMDTQGLTNFLAFLYSPGERTIWRGVRKLLGGHYAVLHLGEGRLEISRYWDVGEGKASREGRAVESLEALLEESASLRLRSDVPVGAFLSGGVDSSIVTAYARDKVDYDFHTFSMGFETYSELDHARKVADYLDTAHHEIRISEEDVARELARVAWHFDEPLGDAATIANYFLAKNARKHVKVVLAGEAGDELFAGYDNYRMNLRYWGLPLSGLLRGVASLPALAFPARIKGDPWKSRPFIAMGYLGSRSLMQLHLTTTRGLSDHEIGWYTGRPPRAYADIILPNGYSSPLNYMLALDLKNMLPEKFLMKADKATMASGVEERLVLMDKEIVEFAFTVPDSLKIRDGRGKWILRKAGERRLSGIRGLLWERKRGFGVPIDDWIRGEMKGMVLQELEGTFLRKSLERYALEKTASRVKAGAIKSFHQANVVWALFALGIWHEQFFG